jgi:flagellar motor switch protein FliG
MAAGTATKLELTGLEKTAVLLMAVGDEAGAALLRALPKSCVQKVVGAISDLGAVRKEESNLVLREALGKAKDREGELRSDPGFVRRILDGAFGPGEDFLLEKETSTDIRPASLAALDNADSKRLTRLLQQEHPQVIALMLAQFKRPQAAELLGALPRELRADVTLRMARLEQIPAQIVAKVAGNFERRLGAPVEQPQEKYRGTRTVADLVNRMDPTLSEETLSAMEAADPSLANEVRDLLFVFEDLIQLDTNAMREIASRTDRRILTVALKGTSDRLKEHFLGTMSQRGAAMLREDMEAMGPTKIKDVLSAQKDVLSVMRKLEAEGVVSTRSVGEQQYVD